MKGGERVDGQKDQQQDQERDGQVMGLTSEAGRPNVRAEIEHRIRRLRHDADNLEALLKFIPEAALESPDAINGLYALMYPDGY